MRKLIDHSTCNVHHTSVQVVCIDIRKKLTTTAVLAFLFVGQSTNTTDEASDLIAFAASTRKITYQSGHIANIYAASIYFEKTDAFNYIMNNFCSKIT
ncbi:hypothetical protein Tcan_06011 [Toxocara canis]|uniref:Uncharacterized protein n=1 Tax=Toxocara canis TaxID=6265 RepID=A0A0B2VSJ2_TOXCA|nr:hypothetical protein Tcan_06011 [Toxocara canis]